MLKELTLKRDRSTSKHRLANQPTAHEPPKSKNSNVLTSSNQFQTSGKLESTDVPLKKETKKKLELKTKPEPRASFSGHKPLSPKSPRKIPVVISPRPASPSPTAISPRQAAPKSPTSVRSKASNPKGKPLEPAPRAKSPPHPKPALMSPKPKSKPIPSKLESPKAKLPSLRSSAAKSPQQKSTPKSPKPLSTSTRSPQVLISTPQRSSVRSGQGQTPNSNRMPSTASPAKEHPNNEEDMYVLEVSKPSMDVTFNS